MKPYNEEDMGDNYGNTSPEILHEKINNHVNEITELHKQVAQLLKDKLNTNRIPCLKSYCISCVHLTRDENQEIFYCSKITTESYEARVEENEYGDTYLEIYNPAKYGCTLYNERLIHTKDNK